MHQTERHAKAVILRTMRSRLRGTNLSDDEIIRHHSDLPSLSSRLGVLGIIRDSIDNPSTAEPYLSGALTDEELDAPIEDLPIRVDCIPGYRIREEISRGGQAVVYRATRLQDERQVAIKIIYGGPFLGQQERKRFIRECSILKGLDHPHVVKVLEHGETGTGSLFLVMDYVDGATIEQWVDARVDRLTPAAVVTLFLDVIAAVSYVHRQSIIHRDLKPANILVDANGQVRVLDFGLSRVTHMDDDTSLTATGQFVGSFAWASPEQSTDGKSKPDEQSDIYSLGLILLRLLTGIKPLPPYTHLQGRKGIARIDIVENSFLNSTRTWLISYPLKDVLKKAIHTEKNRRQPNANAFADELKQAMSQPAYSISHILNIRRVIYCAILIFSVALAGLLLKYKSFPELTSPFRTSTSLSFSPSAAGNAIDPFIPYDAFRFGGHSYLKVQGAYTWDEANQLAKAKGGHLFAINDAAEWAVLQHFFLGKTNLRTRAYWWIGLDDELISQKKWNDGSALEQMNMGPFQFNHEPPGRRALCTDMIGWFYDNRNSVNGYLIEWPRQSAAPFAQGKAPKDAIIIGGRAYKHINQELSWEAARSFCENELKGSLAVFPSQSAEKQFLDSQGFKPSGTSAWIGGLKFNHGTYWLHDITPDYQNWQDSPESQSAVSPISLQSDGWRAEVNPVQKTFICMWPVK